MRETGRTAPIRTFLIADLRGYTHFTEAHGDEAASSIAKQFSEVVRDAVRSQGGQLLELRGDEVLCVFASARRALGAAVDLQRRFREPVEGRPPLALGVGIGLDAGEAVPTQGGFRGRALNIASRLCSLARPGQILASETVISLAGQTEGMTYARRRSVRVKGLADPVRHVEVIPETRLPPPPDLPAPRRRARLALAALACGSVLGAAMTALVLSSGGSNPPVVRANSLALIDPLTNEVTESVPVGRGPKHMAVGDGRLWVLNEADGTISTVDFETHESQTFGSGFVPVDLVVTDRRVWVADGGTGSLVALSPETGASVSRVEVSEAPARGAGGLAYGLGSLWFLSDENHLVRVDPRTEKVMASIELSGLTFDDVAVAEGSVWVAGCCDALQRVDPRTGSVAEVRATADGRMAVGFGSLWIADWTGTTVWRVDSASGDPIQTLHCQDEALGVAVGTDSVWVACGGGTVLRVDPASGDITETIEVGGTPSGISVGGGRVWVAVS